MWPDNETSLDLLGFGDLLSTTLELVKSDWLAPMTIGIYGAWGSGKSSLMTMLQHSLVDDKDTVCLTFNGWAFEGYDDAKAALMSAILTQLKAKQRLDARATEAVRNLLRHVNWMRLAGLAGKQILSLGVAISSGTAVGAPASTSLPSFEEMKEVWIEEPEAEHGPETAADFRSEFARLIEAAKLQRLVVFIDDLDRCLPPTIVQTLEAIKLFLFVPKTVFIVGADERIITQAVATRYSGQSSENRELSRDYLEKLIQFPVRIPPLSTAEMETYINLLFAQKHLSSPDFSSCLKKAEDNRRESVLAVALNFGIVNSTLNAVPSELSKDLELANQVAVPLTSISAGNPRQTKRFLNSLLLRCKMAEARGISLDRQVLAKLMILEYWNDKRFEDLIRWYTADGDTVRLRNLETTARGGEDGEGAKAGEGLPEGSEIWLKDPFLCTWLTTDPPLTDIDLHPYVYFTRGQATPLGALTPTLSPDLQRIVTRLSDGNELEIAAALKAASKIGSEEAHQVCTALVKIVPKKPKIAKPLIDLARGRADLIPIVLDSLQALPPGSVPAAVPLRLVDCVQGTTYQTAARSLLQKWTEEGPKPLRETSKSAISRIQGG